MLHRKLNRVFRNLRRKVRRRLGSRFMLRLVRDTGIVFLSYHFRKATVCFLIGEETPS
jgi:hypothetical protein